ncbi:MAG: hypothetical protein KJ626_05350 [Verrucomicrobia bacterium]|nr:hypothetical protein [Verrucomicrobiota bacterium]
MLSLVLGVSLVTRGEGVGKGQNGKTDGTTAEEREGDSNTNPEGGFVEIQNQVFREVLPLEGTEFTLNYTSWRVVGNRQAYRLEIPLYDVGEDLGEIRVTVHIAGQETFQRDEKPFSSSRYEYEWDGKDGEGEAVTGARTAEYTVEFDQILFPDVDAWGEGDGEAMDDDGDIPYQPLGDPGDWGDIGPSPKRSPRDGGGGGGGTAGNLVRSLQQNTTSMTEGTRMLGVLQAIEQGLGGWTISEHHAYDFEAGMLYRGDGEVRETKTMGAPSCSFSNTTGSATSDVAVVSRDGSELYIFDEEGKHLYTRDTISGSTNFSFTYDTNGLVTVITDRDGLETTVQRETDGEPTKIIGPYGQQTGITLDDNGYLYELVDPMKSTNRLYHDEGGLLTNVISRRGNEFHITYDDEGRVTEVSGPDGQTNTYTRTEGFNVYEVVLGRPFGREKRYKVEQIDGGFTRRVNVGEAGLTNYILRTSDDSVEIRTNANGSVIYIERGEDPRFDMQVPSIEMMTISTPGGLIWSSEVSRAVSLSDAEDLLSLQAWTNDTIINGRTYHSEYVASTKTLTMTTPEGRQYEVEYNSLGRPVSVSLPSLYTIDYTYDSDGRVTGITQDTGTGRSTYLGYGTNGYLGAITNPLSQAIGLDTDHIGRTTNIVRPDNKTIGLKYTASSQLSGVTPPGRTEHSFDYSPVGYMSNYGSPDVGADTNMVFTWDIARKLASITLPGGGTITNEYDSGGRLDIVQWPDNRVEIDYATGGQISTITATNDNVLAFAYDSFLLTNVIMSGGVTGEVGYTYDNNFWLTALSVNGATSFSYSYDLDGLLTDAGDLSATHWDSNGLLTNTMLGNVADFREFSDFAEVTSYDSSCQGVNLLSFDYGYDDLERITGRVEVVEDETNTYNYSYDLAGRLTNVIASGDSAGYTNSYQYDANGNRTNANLSGTTSSGTYNAQDQMTSYGSATYQYSPSGSLTNKTEGANETSYRYDAMGNLLEATLPDSTVIEYTVDGLNRRIAKKVDGTMVQGFIYKDGLNPVAELDGDTNVVSYFVYGTRAYVPDYMVKNGTEYRIISDHVGSIRLVVNAETGDIAQRIDYDEFGNVTSDTNPGFQPFGFAGGIYDADTGLTRFGRRDYDPATGRWTAKDPILFSGGHPNLYTYCHGDPVNWYDPSGLTEDGPGYWPWTWWDLLTWYPHFWYDRGYAVGGPLARAIDEIPDLIDQGQKARQDTFDRIMDPGKSGPVNDQGLSDVMNDLQDVTRDLGSMPGTGMGGPPPTAPTSGTELGQDLISGAVNEGLGGLNGQDGSIDTSP